MKKNNLKMTAAAFALALCASSTADAEHASAPGYRAILSSSRYCLEYVMEKSYGYYSVSYMPQIELSDSAREEAEFFAAGDFDAASRYISFANYAYEQDKKNADSGQGTSIAGLTVYRLAASDGRRFYSKHTESFFPQQPKVQFPVPFGLDKLFGKKKKEPEEAKEEKAPQFSPCYFYKDGMYYSFSMGAGGMASLYDLLSDAQPTYVLQIPENQIDRAKPSAEVIWPVVRRELEMPEALAVFAAAERCDSSGRRVYRGKEYAVDRYRAPIRTAYGDTSGAYVYDILYDADGTMAYAQQFFTTEGQELLLATLTVKKVTGEVAEDAFALREALPVYAAGVGDVNDFLGTRLRAGTMDVHMELSAGESGEDDNE